jgi:phage terminase small subunit
MAAWRGVPVPDRCEVEPDEVPAQIPAGPPQWLTGRAREIWERAADALDGLQGHVTSADEAMLLVWATTVARYERAEQEAASCR